MAPPTHPFLLQIQGLDRNAPNLRQQLDKKLRMPEYEECVEGLDETDLRWFVEYLDGVLDNLGGDRRIVFRRCMRELGRVCRDNEMLPRSFEINGDDLILDEYPFATGGFDDVYKGTLNGTVICAKRLQLYRETAFETKKEFRKEAVMWKYLKHPNVLPFLGATIDPPQLISVWMPGGNLSEYLNNSPDLGGPDRLRLLFDIAKGLGYLHSRWVIHGDLKPVTIVVEERTNIPWARITGFSTAIVTKNLYSARLVAEQKSKTPRWSAPELLEERNLEEQDLEEQDLVEQNHRNPTQKSDVFSFAMIAIQVFTGRVPFPGTPDIAVPLKIVGNKRPPRPRNPSCTDDLWNLIQRCWHREPESRPEISEVLQFLSTLAPPN